MSLRSFFFKKPIAIVPALLVLILCGFGIFQLFGSQPFQRITTDTDKQAPVKSTEEIFAIESEAALSQTPSEDTVQSSAPSRSSAKSPPLTNPEPVTSQPAQPSPLSITSINLTPKSPLYMYNSCYIPFEYMFRFSRASAGGDKIVSHWEYEMIGVPGPYPDTPIAGYNFTLNSGVVGYGDNSLYNTQTGLEADSTFSYRARIHATSPNDMYSEWVTVPMLPYDCQI